MQRRGSWTYVLGYSILALLLSGCVSNLPHSRNEFYFDKNASERELVLKSAGYGGASDSERLKALEILHAARPTSDIILDDLASMHDFDQAALLYQQLYDFLKKEGVVSCGIGLTRTAINAAQHFMQAGNETQALMFAKLADNHAQESGDDQPDCALTLFKHNDESVRREAKDLLISVSNSVIPLGPNPLTVQASGPANKKYVNSLEQEFFYIPPGSFLMGSDKYNNSKRHNVKLTRGYYLQKTEVTQEQWVKIMGSNPSMYKGKLRPVSTIGIADIKAFIKKLNEKEMTTAYRLPTEAEWEYAARAGTDTPWFFGSDAGLLLQFAWFRENSGNVTHPVATRHPNQWGFYDMLGNVREIVSDYYDKDYYAKSPEENPQGPETGYQIVLRGENCKSYSFDTAYRDYAKYNDETNPFAFSGFRLVYAPLTEAERLQLEAQQQIQLDKLQADLVRVPGGCFQMGDTFGDGGTDEKPVHEVCVDSFMIGKYEVTQAQWRAVMINNPSGFLNCGDNCPVENISLNDIQVFLAKLKQRTGKHYRLPTEAEWEYAARSGGRPEKYAGMSSESELADYAWHDKNSEKKPHPVGEKRPNGLGLYDMSGNVWEWCADWYDVAYYAVSPRQNPPGPSAALARVNRGASWNDAPWPVRSTYRHKIEPGKRYNNVGFRLVLAPIQ